MKLSSMRIGKRLSLGFSLVAGIMAATLATSVMLMRNQHSLTQERLSAAHGKTALALQLRGELLESAVAMRNVALESDVAAFQRQADSARRLRKEYAKKLKQFEAQELSAEESALLERIAKFDAAVEAPFFQAVSLAQAMDTEQAIKVISGKVEPVQQQQIAALSEIAHLQEKFLESAEAEARQSFQQTLALTAAAGSVALLLAGVFAWMCTSTVVRPLRRAVVAAKEVAHGNLVLEIRPSHEEKDEAAELLRSLADMADQLRSVVSKVHASSESIATGSSQIACGSIDLSQRTEETAGNLQQTASTMAKLTSTVRGTAETATRATQIAENAAAAANHGGSVVGKVVVSMQNIATSAQRISEITAVIDGIAFQTNILALNAAVEAARAGEQGRGFAVVAAEVRSLAQRSATAAKEIKTLIENSVTTVEEGSGLVNEASLAIQAIVSNVGAVNGLITEISGSANSQSSELEGVADAVAQLDSVTQQNAALVEESAAAAESLKRQAASLNVLMSNFKVA